MPERDQSIGFIGLGLMGQAFTKRLVGCGYRVSGYDLDPDKVAAAASHGVIGAAAPADVLAAADIVLLCVTSTDAVRAVALGEDGLKDADGQTKVIVDHSTTEVGETREIARDLGEANGAGWVDAPVSGGPPAAAEGRLAIMAGGTDGDIARVRPVMDQLAEVFTHFGPVGAGQVAKMVNQVLVLNNYCVLAEALALAEAGGIDAAKIPDALAAGHAGSNLLKAMFPRLIARDFAPAGFARQVLKDLDMVHDIAKALNVPTPMSGQAAALFRLLVSKGHGGLDGLAVLKLYDPDDHV